MATTRTSKRGVRAVKAVTRKAANARKVGTAPRKGRATVARRTTSKADVRVAERVLTRPPLIEPVPNPDVGATPLAEVRRGNVVPIEPPPRPSRMVPVAERRMLASSIAKSLRGVSPDTWDSIIAEAHREYEAQTKADRKAA